MSVGVVGYGLGRRHAIETVEHVPFTVLSNPPLNGKGTIRLAFVTENCTFEAKEYATDDLGEALAAYGAEHLSGGPPNSGPESWVLCFIVEQGEARMSQEERLRRFRELLSIEQFRATR